jgi:hypothetical protein
VPPSPTVTTNQLTLNHSMLRAGQTLIATGHKFEAGEKVQFVLYPGPMVVGSFMADSTGTVRATTVISPATATGTHTIEATGWNSSRVAAARFAVIRDIGIGKPTMPWVIWLVGGCSVAGAVLAAGVVGLGWLPGVAAHLGVGGR